MVSSERKKVKKVAVGCQGGGMHAAFEVGVLAEILKDCGKKKFELVGLSGTSAGALCALMVWYGLAPKAGKPGSEDAAIDCLNDFWNDFVASTGAETVLNFLTYGTFWAEEKEIPVLGVNAPILGLNPYGALFRAFAASLPSLGIRKQYFDLEEMLAKACPDFDRIAWQDLTTRVLIGASEVVNGFETVFDSDVNRKQQQQNKGMQPVKVTKDRSHYWRQKLPLTLSGVAASGTLPALREAEHIKPGGHYWDGLYSQNPPVREFFDPPVDKDKHPKRTKKGDDERTKHVPDELWIIRINPQQWPEVPASNKDIQDRQNELMGNLSLNKDLDFIMTVNAWTEDYKDQQFAIDHKPVTVRTIKMEKKTADALSYSSKFDRSHAFMDELRREGREVARDWLHQWHNGHARCYPEDAAY
jgi:NTE family protein